MMSNPPSPTGYKILSGSMLKLIAMVSMLIDHTAVILRPEIAALELPLFILAGKEITVYYLMRKLGRLAFPLFCFLISEGAFHTKDRKKYSARLLLFAVISELPFNMMRSGNLFDPSKQNIYFTLFLGVVLISIFETITSERKKALLMIAAAVLAASLRSDYGLNGALLILLLYVLRNQTVARAILAYPLLSGGIAAFAAFVPICMYNGRRGFIQSGWLKYGFYLFYPVHIILLILIRFALGS